MPADKRRFALAIHALAEYYGKPMSDGVLSLYWQGLDGYDINVIESAIGKHLRNPDNGTWMPKIADIIKMIEGNTADMAVVAWKKVIDAISRVGQYQSIAFDDPLIHAAIDGIGGWPALCQLPETELVFVQKRFEQIYRGYRSRGETPVYPRYLVGVSEIQNAGSGYKPSPPRLVGNQERAALVVRNGSDNAALPVSPAGLALPIFERLADQRESA